jgi:ribokinase
MGTVVVLGSLITDVVARAPRMPLPGEALFGEDFATFLGGKGINQAIAAARLGAHVTLIGRVGTDSFGDAFFPVLTQENINSLYVERDPTVGTGVSVLISASNTGQNMSVVNPRANMAVTAESVEKALRAVHEEHSQSAPSQQLVIFLAQCETSQVSVVTGLQLAHTLGMRILLNAAPIPRKPLSDELLALVDTLIVNEAEAAALANLHVSSLETAIVVAERLLTRGSRNVIVTLGAQGCVWSTREASTGQPVHHAIPAIMVKAVDTTAAGDAFCGALAAGLADGLPLHTALQRAIAAGAITATRMGAIAALPTASEVEELLARDSHSTDRINQEKERGKS